MLFRSPPCLENPRPEGAESTLTENAASPFHAEPRHPRFASPSSSLLVNTRGPAADNDRVLRFGAVSLRTTVRSDEKELPTLPCCPRKPRPLGPRRRLQPLRPEAQLGVVADTFPFFGRYSEPRQPRVVTEQFMRPHHLIRGREGVFQSEHFPAAGAPGFRFRTAFPGTLPRPTI